jgi:hypothetical protein
MSDLIKLDFTTVNKSNYKVMANSLAEVVENGVVSPLDAYTRLKAIEAMVTEARKLIDASAKSELSKYDKSEKVVFNGYDLSQRESGVSYDFEACKDEEWNELNRVITDYKSEIKKREDFLKAVKAPINIVNNWGEPVTIHPPVKRSSTSIISG